MKNFKIGMKPLGASLAVTALLGSLAVPGVAHASSKGRKNTAIGLGAATAHQLLKGKTTNAVILGAGTAYAYKRYQDARGDKNRRQRSAAYRNNATRTSRTSNAYRSGSAYGGASPQTARSTRTTRTTRATRNRNSAYVPPQTSRAKVVPGTYVFTGPVARVPAFDSRTLTVDHNGILRPATVTANAVVTRDGSQISMHDLQPGETVRVTAVQVAPNVWRASRINVVEPIVQTARIPSSRVDTTYREDRITRRERLDTADRRTDRVIRRERVGSADRDDVITRRDRYETYDRGELTLADYVGTGVVESVHTSDNSFRVRIGSNTRLVFAEYANMAGVDRVRDLRKGDRVRVVGDIYGRDVFATAVEMLD